MLSGDWRGLGEFSCPLAHLVCQHELTTAEKLDLAEIGDGALARHLEAGEAFHFVAEKVDADRVGRGRAEDVDDASPHGQFPASLDLVLPPIAGPHESSHKIFRVELGALADNDRGGVLDPRTEPLQQRPDRGDDDARTAFRPRRGQAHGGGSVAQAPHRTQPATHGLGRGRDALEGERLPRRQQFHHLWP